MPPSPIVCTPAQNSPAMLETKLAEIGDASVESLVAQSDAARAMAYCAYSQFRVGAALLCKDGTVFTGCNVENLSFGLTICAERTAVVKAVSEGHKEFEAIAVSAVMGEALTSPCGACRQFLAEFNPEIKIYLHNPNTKTIGVTSLAELLPHCFAPRTINTPNCSNPFIPQANLLN